jgi:hypothetical protein
MTVSQEDMDTYPAPSSAIADYLRRSVSVSYLVNRMWTGRLIIIAATLAGLLYGMYSAHSSGPLYSASMAISPAESDAIGDIGSSGGGGAAGLLAGLTGTTNTMALPKFTQFISSMGSVGVARELIKRHDLLCRIYRSDCDPVTHQWHERTGVREFFNGLLAKLGGLPDPNGPRTEIDLALYLRGAVVPSINKTNSLVTLTFEHPRPEFAAQVLSAVVATTNDHIRAQNRDVQKRYVEYLSQNAAKTTNVEQRQAIDTLLLQQERQLMMTEVDLPYAAKILDGPTVVPINKVLKTLVIYSFLGFVLGAVLAIFREMLPGKWRR